MEEESVVPVHNNIDVFAVNRRKFKHRRGYVVVGRKLPLVFDVRVGNLDVKLGFFVLHKIIAHHFIGVFVADIGAEHDIRYLVNKRHGLMSLA